MFKGAAMEMRKGNLIFLILIFGLVLFIFGCIETPVPAKAVCGDAVIEKEEECEKLDDCIEKEGFEISCEECECVYAEKEIEEEFLNPDRDAYGTGIFIDENRVPYEQKIENVFVNLPEMPSDFAEVKFNLEDGNYDFMVANLTEEYYRQPEFLPNFEQAALAYWKAPDLTHWGVYGYGFYPSKLFYEMRNEQSLDVYFFVHSAWNVETYQGAKIVPVISDELKEKFDFEISPENILLEPTYPIVSENWIYKIKATITPKSDLETGAYEFKFDFAKPDSELNSEWGEKYKYYFPVGSGGSSSKSGVEVKLIVS